MLGSNILKQWTRSQVRIQFFVHLGDTLPDIQHTWNNNKKWLHLATDGIPTGFSFGVMLLHCVDFNMTPEESWCFCAPQKGLDHSAWAQGWVHIRTSSLVDVPLWASYSRLLLWCQGHIQNTIAFHCTQCKKAIEYHFHWGPRGWNQVKELIVCWPKHWPIIERTKLGNIVNHLSARPVVSLDCTIFQLRPIFTSDLRCRPKWSSTINSLSVWTPYLPQAQICLSCQMTSTWVLMNLYDWWGYFQASNQGEQLDACVGTRHPLSQTYASVSDGPPGIKGVQGIALTSPGMQSEGTDQTRLPKMTCAETLDNHLPVQDKPGLRLVTWSHSQVTHLTWFSVKKKVR